jgi:hypothetical protein
MQGPWFALAIKEDRTFRQKNDTVTMITNRKRIRSNEVTMITSTEEQYGDDDHLEAKIQEQSGDDDDAGGRLGEDRGQSTCRWPARHGRLSHPPLP